MKFIVGADPGMTGALALLDQHGNLIATADISGTNGRVDSGAVRDNLKRWRKTVGIDMAVVENVGSMPKQGVSTTFKFGRATGNLEGVIQGMEIPMDLLTPAQWKTKLKMTGKAKLKGQARADAACLALAWLEMHPEFREQLTDREYVTAEFRKSLRGGQEIGPSKRPPPRRRIVP
jgi:crossover junction endodeoxyribonuclease RuvC